MMEQQPAIGSEVLYNGKRWRIAAIENGEAELEEIDTSADVQPIASHQTAAPERLSGFTHRVPPSTIDPEDLPTIGGMVGSAGGPAGAAAGGAAGTLGRDLMRANRGDPRTPQTALSAAGNVGTEAAIQGVLTKSGELVGRGVERFGRAVTNRAVPMVRSALKQPWMDARRRAGIEGVMPSAVANQQAKFIVDQQLKTPEQAEALIKSLGGRIDEQISAAERADPALAIDSASRVPRYLNAVLRKIEQQLLPGKDRAAVQGVGRELVLDSPLSRSTYQPPAPETLESGLARGVNEARTIARNAPVESVAAQRPRLLNPNLKELQNQTPPRTGVIRDVEPVSELDALLQRADTTVQARPARQPATPPPRPQNASQFTDAGGAFPQSSRPRALRTDVRPSEAAQMVRAKSFFDKDASGGQIAGGKAIERAVRDGIKDAVPSTRPLLRAQGRAIDARTALDRATWRDANRDQIGMGGIAGLANGRPLIGMLLQALKEGQLSTGLAAGRYGPQIERTGLPAGVSAEQLFRLLEQALQEQE